MCLPLQTQETLYIPMVFSHIDPYEYYMNMPLDGFSLVFPPLPSFFPTFS